MNIAISFHKALSLPKLVLKLSNASSSLVVRMNREKPQTQLGSCFFALSPVFIFKQPLRELAYLVWFFLSAFSSSSQRLTPSHLHFLHI